MARVAAFQEGTEGGDAGEESEERIKISQQYCKPLPKYEWLREGNINAKAITAWLKDEAALIVNGQKFVDALGTKKPGVELWKETPGLLRRPICKPLISRMHGRTTRAATLEC